MNKKLLGIVLGLVAMFSAIGFVGVQAKTDIGNMTRDQLMALITELMAQTAETGTTIPTTSTTNLPAGCTTIAGYSPITGEACSSVNTVVLPKGCTSTVGFSPTTGQSCSATSTVTPTTPVATTVKGVSSGSTWNETVSSDLKLETGTTESSYIDVQSNEELECIDYTKASNYIGENVCITGKVNNVFNSSGTYFLNFCSNYKTCPFSSVIFKSDNYKFSNIYNYDEEVVEINGVVTTYQGRPQIILKNTNQIKIIEKESIFTTNEIVNNIGTTADMLELNPAEEVQFQNWWKPVAQKYHLVLNMQDYDMHKYFFKEIGIKHMSWNFFSGGFLQESYPLTDFIVENGKIINLSEEYRINN
ncbi:MAG: hypothetical protein M0P49_00085 [Bacilli bacterium]|nr:hypothetical protein [Bacilli bacterium]